MPNEIETQQDRFNRLYITSGEIQQRLNVQRYSIAHAKKRGTLPEPVTVPGVRAFIWERKNVEPYLDAWEKALILKRREFGKLKHD